MLRMFCLLLVLWPAASGSVAQAAGTCAPSPLGQPCQQGGLAVAPGAEPGLNLGAGNPIHIATGNKYQKEIDLPANATAPGIEIIRHYNGLDGRVSALGLGWSLSYDTRLFYAGGNWQIVQADGSRIAFSNTGGAPQANKHGSLKAAGKYRIWTWPTGRQLWFNADGYLLRILDGQQTGVEIQRNIQPGPLAGTIASVTNSHGHRLAFSYRVTGGRAYLLHIDSALGRFQYRHEAMGDNALTSPLRLTGMVRPDGMQRRYLYEPELQAGNTTALTGIEILSSGQKLTQRTNTWGYDAQGRAVLSIRGGPESQADKLSVQYLRQATHQQAGLTVVTDASRRETRFESAIKGGRIVLTRVSGAGCPGCAAPGSQASYDGQGRLLEVNGTRLQRDSAGAIRQIQPLGVGWPGLSMQYQSNGYRASWSSTATGTERVVYNAQSLPTQRLWANGDSVAYQYDAQGRPVLLIEKSTSATQQTTLRWRGRRLLHIGHPNETESRQYDRQGRLTRRSIERISAQANAAFRYTESFEYDHHHRLVQHRLPEGGSLLYRWGAGNRLMGIIWQDANGQPHTVINSTPGQAGYCHGNGLCSTTTLDKQGQARRLAVTHEAHEVWSQNLYYDKHGRLQHEQHTATKAGHSESWRYAYDENSRLIGVQGETNPALSATAMPDTVWYAWNDDGSLAGSRVQGATYKPAIRRDASGLPLAVDDATLNYGPNRRLAAVHRQGKTAASYSHNAFGHRIVTRSDQGNTDYFYLNNQLVAESARTGTSTGPDNIALGITRRYIYAHQAPVAFIDYSASSSSAQLYAIHADLIGAPRVVTDAAQTVRWLATYSPTGAASRLAGDLTLDLRLPGQVFDAASGWHDNVFRTYLPELGQYLEPDPLGPVPGNQALGYANQQARRYADPLGLLLFAFDGTRNGPETFSNVWKMSQAYRDGPVFYHSGPGNPLYMDWDGATAWQAARIIENQWQSLLNELQQSGSLTDHLPIDIIGYSRGAALARHFGNLINQYVDNGLFSYTSNSRGRITACVDLRFMGLFDTVAQFGVAGSQNANYDLTIASAWEWVAHAVALHERRWLFPLTTAGDTGGYNIIEAPFIGAHADIGGGALPDGNGQPSLRGDLADVALNWMLWQARAASLRFGVLSESDREIADPLLHDERSALLRSVQDGDRSVQSAAGSPLFVYQDYHAQLGRTQRAETEGLIARHDNWRASDTSEVGVVDMAGYARWLHDELGWQALPA